MTQKHDSKGCRVTIVDAIMGTGKTTWAIEEMHRRHRESLFSNDGRPARFLYIAPTLDEVERIKTSCQALHFIDPFPQNGRKLCHLNQLLDEGRNVVSTHALFRRVDHETIEALRGSNYTLIIDEALTCIEHFEIKKDDRRNLFANEMVLVDECGVLRWNHQKWGDYDGRFNDIRSLCDNGNLVWHRGKFLIWQFPPDLFRCFDDVYVLTYMFRGSFMRPYLTMHDIPFQMATIRDGKLTRPRAGDEAEIKAQLRRLITVVDDPKLNAVGDARGRRAQPLSASWYKQTTKARPDDLKKLRRATENYFRHHAGTPSSANMWTTFKAASPKLKGKGYARGFIPVTCKGTNDYIDRQSLAYLVNVFPNPLEVGYFMDRGIDVDKGAYALSSMLQWIWRSQVRRGDPIMLFIPSKRMRDLFLDWLHDRHEERDSGYAAMAA
jgi:hypothetical protein